MVPWQMNSTFIGISYLQNCIKLLQFARLLKLRSFYRKTGQMAKSRKVWQILAVNRSQNVVFYGGINYSRPGVGAFQFAVGAFHFAVGAFPWVHFCTHAPIFVGAFAPTAIST